MGRKDKAVPTEDIEALSIGARMRLARQKKNISLSQMARRLEYSTSYLSTVENELASSPRKLVEEYERDLGLEPGELLEIYERDVRIGGSNISKSTIEKQRRRKGFKENWGDFPAVSHFYGRETELKDLGHLITVENCQVVAILGLGGIGKTTLAAKVAEQTQNDFKFVFWRSLQNAPPVEDILDNCLRLMSENEQVNRPPNLDDQVRLLIEFLRKYRCLIILDNLEAILGTGELTNQYHHDYTGYGLLLQRIGEVSHQSCLLVTSREKPKDIALLEAKTMPVRSIQLAGLGQAEATRILQDKELRGTDIERNNLIDLYDGNPLALKLVSECIREVFDRSISHFLKEGEPFFGDVYTLLEQQFARLSRLETEIMYWLTIGREEVSLDELQEDFAEPILKRELLWAIDTLQRRFMIELKGSGKFIVQPVILQYVTSRLIEQTYREIESGNFELLDRLALIKAQAKEYIRASQIRFILEPVIERLRSQRGKTGCEERIKGLLSALRASHVQSSGYRVGNLLNLLVQMGADFRGFDFSYLTIWQAYLQGVDLPEVSFAHASFAKTVFTDSFGTILSVAVSSNGEYLSAGTANGMIRLWRLVNSELLFACQEHKDWVRSVAFNPDGSLLASGSDDQTIRLWDIKSGKSLRVLQGHTHRVRSVAFSPDGSLLVSSSDDRTIRIWNVDNGECLRVLQGHEYRVRTVAFNPSGSLLASGSDDYMIRLWDTEEGNCLLILEGHTHRVRSVAFSPDGSLLASSSDDRTIRLWDTKSGVCLRVLEGHTQIVRSVTFSPDGVSLVSGSEDWTIRLWDIKSGEYYRVLRDHANAVRSVQFTPDGSLLVSGSDDQTIRYWDSYTGQCVKTLQGYSSCIYSVAFSPDGTLLASGNHNHKVSIWSVGAETYKTMQKHQGLVYSVSFNPTGDMLASGSQDHTICLWDVATGEYLRTLHGHSNQINSVAFSSEGNLLASGSEDNTVRLWEVNTSECLQVLKGHTNRIRSVAFSPRGVLLASGSEDTSIRFWEVNTGLPVGVLQGHDDQVRTVAFNPDGTLLASGGEDNIVCLWDAVTRRLLDKLSGHSDRVRTVAFSPDGNLLASGCDDAMIRIWEVRSRQPLRLLQGHAGLIYAVAFNRDNKTIASGSYDGTIKIWDIPTANCLQTLHLGRPYEGMNIEGVIGLTMQQKKILEVLGATGD